jgi:NMD protein affecting ribosome stability and mRNA decay
MIETEEPGVCVSCRAVADKLHVITPELSFPVCSECQQDGTYHNWLTREFEKAAEANGDLLRITEDGRRLSP